MKLPIGSYEAIFLQMQPNLVSHLEFVWNLMLIMALLVLGIGFLQNIMDLLSDVLNPFNELGRFVGLCVSIDKSWLMWVKWEELYQWGPIVETLG